MHLIYLIDLISKGEDINPYVHPKDKPYIIFILGFLKGQDPRYKGPIVFLIDGLMGKHELGSYIMYT